jgi:Na+/H+-translocating membrane pyrophosphatase
MGMWSAPVSPYEFLAGGFYRIRPFWRDISMSVLFAVIACGLLSVVYAIWATKSVMAADQGNARMQEIAGYIREGAQAYLNRQYTTIAIVGAVVFVITWFFSAQPPPSAS